ncbi:hypothetical protein OOZ51_15725 [Arthrobacter sp. MI7-26]|uniref:hypothetical protein n=1 Tax=Arthrobacter sp. MI7-26 TaxID=2993653 RepID=UPI0022491E09|nr:hypothetical protein [Arthrobacter sp. MI7-26]MCX2749252.1 hypothetical protein [Arthrobacter sp. MI7-26]
MIEHFKDTYEKKLVSWAHLGANLPSRLITIAPLTETYLTVDGVVLEIRQASTNLGDRAWFVYEPAERVLIGGVLFEGLHVWTANSPTREQREEWIRVLDSFDPLNPSFVSAGHRVTGSLIDLTSIHHPRLPAVLRNNSCESSGCRHCGSCAEGRLPRRRAGYCRHAGH